jgi:hypothetical protein
MLARFGTFGTIAGIVLGLLATLAAMQNNQYMGAGLCLLAAVAGAAVALYYSSKDR